MTSISLFPIHTTHPILSFHFSTSLSSCAGDFFSVLSKVLGERDDIVPVHKYNPVNAARAQARLLAEIDSIMQKKDMGWPWLGSKAREDAVLVRDRVHKFHQLESTVPPSKSGTGAARGEKQGGFGPPFITPTKNSFAFSSHCSILYIRTTVSDTSVYGH